MKAIKSDEQDLKKSGIEWVGKSPSSWKLIANKYVMHKEKILCEKWNHEDVLSLTMNGVIVRDLVNPTGKMPATFDGYQYSEKGDLLMCLFDIDVTPRCVGRVYNDGVTSPAYSNFKLHDNADLGYYYYYYLMMDHTKELLHLAKNLRHSFTEEQLGQLKVPLPPLNEQKAIADYLDDRCSKIGTIIAEAKASIEEYKELKQAVIYDAVTKGLDKNAEMKDSGVEWIGKTPCTWKVIRVKYLLSEINNRSEHGMEEPLSVSQVLGIVPSSQISVANPTSSYVGQKIVEKHDMVFNRLKAHLGVFFETKYKGLVSPDYAVFRANSRVNPKFLEYLFHTPAAITEFKKYITGVGDGLRRLYTGDLFNISVSIPSIEEQCEIVSSVESKVHKLNSLMTEKQSLIEDLESYKKSLIYEVVTGKRKVVD